MNKTLVLYTHSDMIDVWPVFFGQLEKYLENYKVIVFINKQNEAIPKYCTQIEYDDSQLYTDRLVSCLSKIQNDTVLFLHEDMILYDSPDYEYLNLYTKLVDSDSVNSIKLISVGDNFINSSIENTLVNNDIEG